MRSRIASQSTKQDTEPRQKNNSHSSLESALSPKQLETLFTSSASNQNGRDPRSMITKLASTRNKIGTRSPCISNRQGQNFRNLNPASILLINSVRLFQQIETLSEHRSQKLKPIKQSLNRKIGATKKSLPRKNCNVARGSPIRPSFSGVEQETATRKIRFRHRQSQEN